MATTEGVDLSRLQQHTPFRTLHLSLIDLMKYVSVGTSELLLYLLKETHVILECRACSNLFRDVPYLVAHKRFYCTQTYDFSLQSNGNSKGPPEGDLAAFFKAESPLNEEDFLKHSVELAKKNLQNSQVDSYVRKEPTKRQFYDAVQKQLELTRTNSPHSRSYSFEPLENTNVAMKVISSNEDPSKQENTECEGCLHAKEFENSSDKNDAQNNEVKVDGEKFNRSTSSSSISSMSSSSHSSDNKTDAPGAKSNLRNTPSEYRSLHCLKCNTMMPSQKAMSDHQMAVHPEDAPRRIVHSCGNANHVSPFVDLSQQRINGLQHRIRKTDWLKPKGCVSTAEKIAPTVYNPAKEALDARKKAQANLLALKEEQLAYENEILQQKVIRGIIPKSSRGRKKFRCESCGKIFSKMDTLRCHLRDCIDWEHVSQPIRNLRLPMPAISDVNGPSLPMSAPASVDWQDTSRDEPPKPPTPGPQFPPKPPTPGPQFPPKPPTQGPQFPPKPSTPGPQYLHKPPTPGPQFRSHILKTENPCAHIVPSKSTVPVRSNEKFPIKLQNINGVIKNAVENPARGQVLVMNPKVKETKPIFLPLSNTNATDKLGSPRNPSPVEIYPKFIRIGDSAVGKPPLLPAHFHINRNNGNSSPDLISITGRNPQTVAPANRPGSLESPVGNEVKDVEIIAVSPPNTMDQTPVNLQVNNQQQTTVLNMNVNSREQVNTVPCNCAQCEAGTVNLDNPVNDPSPTPPPTGCRDCVECQKSSACSSACCMKDVEIVEQFTSLPPEGTNAKFSMPNSGYQQEVPSNDGDDVIITSHNFSRPEPKQNVPPIIIAPNEKGPPNTQSSKQNDDSPDECVVISFSSENTQISNTQISNTQISNTQISNTQISNTQISNTQISNTQISDSPINVQRPSYPVPMITSETEITSCRSYMRPVVWRQFKCKFCIFSHKTFLGCKFHLKKKHAQKILTCNIQCINHYIVDLKCRDRKTCCSFPSKHCKQLQEHTLNSGSTAVSKLNSGSKLNPESTAGSSSLQKVTPQIKDSSPVKKSAQSAKKTKNLSRSPQKTAEDLMDTKKRQCLECRHKFQTVFNLQRHVVRHLGKNFQCKSCSSLMYTSSECRSHIKKAHMGRVKGITLKTVDSFVVDLKSKQKSSGSDNKQKSPGSDKKNNADNSSPPVLSPVLPEAGSASRNHPEAAQLSVLSTRKSSYQKPELLLETKAKPTKRNLKK